ncbi:MAG: ABC transporter permease [Candidatus Undinarchaeales archaeon]
MLDLTFKDIKGHKIRTFLTILGVVIAIGAVVSLGSISEGMNELVTEQMEMFSGMIEITEAGVEPSPSAAASTKIDIDVLDDIRAMDGVDEAVPALARQVPMQGVIFGMDLDNLDLFGLENIEIDEGRWPYEGEYEVVIGDAIAENQDLALGDTTKIEGKEMEIVGILEKTDSMFDMLIAMEFETAQDVFEEHETVTSMYVKAEDPEDVEYLAEEIESEFPYLDAWTSEEGVEMAEDMIGNVRIITLGIGIIAAFVAAIGIINTMFMSVSERTRELGIMKAVGATKKQIMRQILEEAGVLSVFGGLFGLLFGIIGTEAMNLYMGVPLARVTPVLALSGLLFGILLSLAAAYYPAVKASEVDAIDAIRGAK